MRRAIAPLRALEDHPASAAALRTVAALGLAGALLFTTLALIASQGSGSGGDDPEVLGATLEDEGDLEVASTEEGAFFIYAQDPRDNVSGSATVIVKDRGEVSLTVVGNPDDGRAIVAATVENATDGVIAFEDGLVVSVEITRDGARWKTVAPADRAVTELAPGERARVSTEVALDAYGEYVLSAEVSFTRR